jgi:O-acetyl-ADP-ribose deacetylase (regulator of RNase III)
MEVHVGKTRLRLVKGDITEQDVDAIVNAANNRFWMGSGVAGAIKAKGGEEIELEAMRNGPAEIGEAIVTGAGKLKHKGVIHAAVMGQELETSEVAIRKATKNTIAVADTKGYESIAVPAFGTGVGHFPAHESAKAIIDSAINSLIDAKSLKEFRIVLMSDGIYNIFKTELEAHFTRHV